MLREEGSIIADNAEDIFQSPQRDKPAAFVDLYDRLANDFIPPDCLRRENHRGLSLNVSGNSESAPTKTKEWDRAAMSYSSSRRSRKHPDLRRDIDREGVAGTDDKGEMPSETPTVPDPALCYSLQMDFFLFDLQLAHSHPPERYYPPTPLQQSSVPASSTLLSSPFMDGSLGVLSSTSWSSSANFQRLL
ncbi:hypothetical protein ARMSODRAFT_1022373 [Armillaria solidipes]|uniref:Uncharacterized protein n=1 Tax=Armillaria solidipes TaxID=1076256 RepID=A0A2H3BL21_9AGAR|nr:hypothetical protein ARMSODRAFT_1022373 [Armillaria solidipes]